MHKKFIVFMKIILTRMSKNDNMYINKLILFFIKSSRGNGPMTLRQPPNGIGAKSNGT